MHMYDTLNTAHRTNTTVLKPIHRVKVDI